MERRGNEEFYRSVNDRTRCDQKIPGLGGLDIGEKPPKNVNRTKNLLIFEMTPPHPHFLVHLKIYFGHEINVISKNRENTISAVENITSVLCVLMTGAH